MKHKTIMYALLFYGGLFAGICQSNTLASGQDATGSGGSMSYSIGQTDYAFISSSMGSVNQGVQQPYEIYILDTEEFTATEIEIALFPNPTNGIISLHIGSFANTSMTYSLYDISGRLLVEESIGLEITTINMESYLTATYLLQIEDGNIPVKSFQIIKN